MQSFRAMPIYEFRCPDCDHSFEEMVDFGKTAACPECGYEKTSRKISLFSRPRSGASNAESGASSNTPESSGPVGFHIGGKGTKMIGCTNHGGAVGMQIAEGAEVESHGFRSTGAGVGIDNAGTLVDTDTNIT
jgi:putative FmdB family regulatory protein